MSSNVSAVQGDKSSPLGRLAKYNLSDPDDDVASSPAPPSVESPVDTVEAGPADTGAPSVDPSPSPLQSLSIKGRWPPSPEPVAEQGPEQRVSLSLPISSLSETSQRLFGRDKPARPSLSGVSLAAHERLQAENKRLMADLETSRRENEQLAGTQAAERNAAQAARDEVARLSAEIARLNGQLDKLKMHSTFPARNTLWIYQTGQPDAGVKALAQAHSHGDNWLKYITVA